MLKPPVSIDNLMKEWSIDSKVDSTEPAEELIHIPSLHSKYLNILTYHNSVIHKLSVDFNKMKRVKTDYYHGDLNHPEDLEKYGWPPMHKKVLRQDIPTYLDADDDLNAILLKKLAHKEVTNFCESVLRELNSRTYQLSRYIEYIKFTGGR